MYACMLVRVCVSERVSVCVFACVCVCVCVCKWKDFLHVQMEIFHTTDIHS